MLFGVVAGLVCAMALVVVDASGSGPQSCESRVRCTTAPLEERYCMAFDVTLDPARLPALTTSLARQRSATLDRGALRVSCQGELPLPLLRNAFGVSGGVYGNLDVDHEPPSSSCGSNTTDVANRPVTILINRDMGGNIFHTFFNVAHHLLRASRAFGVPLTHASTTVLLIDGNVLSSMETQLLQSLLGASQMPERIEHWATRPVLKPARCLPAVLLGVGRHWRSWLGVDNNGHDLLALARWVREALGLPSQPRARALVTVVERVGPRAFANLNALEAALRSVAPVEVRRVRMEQLTLREQVGLVSESRVLVAVHGAALAFIPFLPTVATVVEVVPWAHGDPAFFSHITAAVDGVTHVRIDAEASLQPVQVLRARAPFMSPVTVNVTRVVQAVARALL